MGGEPEGAPRVSRAEQRLQRSRRRRGVTIVLVLLVVAGAGVAAAYRIGGGQQDTRTVVPGLRRQLVVRPGEPTIQIADDLARLGVIADARQFRRQAEQRGVDADLKPGTYQVTTGTDVDALLDLLARGPVTSQLVIPEGWTVRQTADRMATAGHFPRSAVARALADPTLDVPYRPKGIKTLEGLLFPSTYPVSPDQTPQDVVQAMLDQLFTVVSRHDLAAAPRHLSAYDLLKVASMIEREARVPGDRPKIAAVIYNRLAKRVPLQIDATVQYALGQPKARLRTADTRIRSPYNTYLRAGLPPTPICSPGEASIVAALRPAAGNWLYYVVVSAAGRHAFTADFRQFQQWKAAAQRKGLL